MKWNKGYTSTYYMAVVDKATWRDIQRIEITGGNIDRTIDGLRESATIDCTDYPDDIEVWIRVWLDTNQDGAYDHVPLFTGLATSPEVDIDGTRQSRSLEAYSVLKPVADINLLRGWYAPAGMSGGAVIRDLLSATPAPVVIADNAPALSSNIIAADNETRLEMIENVLTAINWQLRIDGDGTINVIPKDDTPVATFDPLDNAVIETQITVSADWFNCPNVFMAVDEDLTAIARDDSLTSLVSTVNRGREVWMQDSNCELAANESIEQYAQRRLKEEQQIQTSASYDRRYVPGVYPGSVVRLHYPEQGLDGLYKVTSQGVEIGFSARTSEEIITL